MKKKIFFLFICVTLFLIAWTVFTLDRVPKANDESFCPFCERRIIDYQKFYENDTVMVLLTHKPVFPGHSLIVPKRHVERYEDLLDEEIVEIHHAIQKTNQVVSKVFGTSSYLLLQKNGVEVGQTVPHLHFHYIPRKRGDTSVLKLWFKFLVAGHKDPISQKEMLSITSELKEAIEEL